MAPISIRSYAIDVAGAPQHRLARSDVHRPLTKWRSPSPLRRPPSRRGKRFVRGVRRLPCACQRDEQAKRAAESMGLVHLVCGTSGSGVATVLEYGWS